MVVTLPAGDGPPVLAAAGAAVAGPTVIGRVPGVIDLSSARVVAVADDVPSPGGGGPVAHHHEQITALAIWTITHNLGFNPAGVVARDATGLIEPANITYPDPDTCVLTWSVPVAGSVDLS